MERFLAEARAIAALDHPNIVRAYNVDKEGDRYYLVMEYVDGRDLQRIVEEQGPLSYAVAADAVRQAADGLAHAHRRGMIHCDIKPSNLLVNNQGIVKILDMGLARLTRDAADKTATPQDRQFLGTVDYMAPEQALGSEALDHRADIYSLGCTFYFLLTGHPPFPDGTLAQRIVKHQTQHPASIIAQRVDAPRNLVQICRKMMGIAPGDRYQSAEEVSRVLAAWDPKSSGLKRAAPLEEAGPASAESQNLEDIIAAAAQGETGSLAASRTAKASTGLAAAWQRWNPLRALGLSRAGTVLGRAAGALLYGQRLVILIAIVSVIMLVVAAAVAIPMILKQPAPPGPGSTKPPAAQERTAPTKSPGARPKLKE
jgi:serine/threonine protein kinase